TQRPAGTECELPPTRFLYIYTSWLWKCVQFGAQPPLSMAELQQPAILSNGQRWACQCISHAWQYSQLCRALPFPVDAFPTDLSEDRSKDPDHCDPALASLHRVACLFSI